MRSSLRLAVVTLSLAAAGLPDVHAGAAREMKTIVDASSGVTRIDLGGPGAPGRLLIFDEILLDDKGDRIGSNSGFCIGASPGEFSECQWTLTLADGSITVAGREARAGASDIPIVGGTGAYAGATGLMTTFPSENRTFTQVLKFDLPKR